MLDKNKLHIVELNDDMVFNEGDNVFNYCKCDGKVYKTALDVRGKKSKFWIINDEGEHKYLVKYDLRENDSLDNVGQFIACGILEQIEIPAAEYLITDFSYNGKEYDAIISKNYRKSESELNISAYSLNRKNSERDFDNNMGVKSKHKHTIKHYLEIIQKLYGKRNDIDLKELDFELSAYALIQYVYVMSDLHYYNLTMVYEEDKGHKSLRFSDMYDCGNICGLNLSKKKVLNNLTRIKQAFEKSGEKAAANVIENIIYKKMPLLGIETEMCTIEPSGTQNNANICRPICMSLTGVEQEKRAKEDIERFRNELALKILENPRLQDLYEKMKAVDYAKIAGHYNSIKEGLIPDYCVEMVQLFSAHNIKNLDRTIENQKRIKQEELNKENTGERIKK